jgi:hypothetical protein
MHLLSSHLLEFGASISLGETRLVFSMGYTTFKPFLGSWGVYDFPILYLLCSVLQALHGLTLFCTRVMTFLDSLQCLVFLPFLLLDDLAQSSSLLLSLIFYFTLLLSTLRLSTVKGSFVFFSQLLLSPIDTFYAIKEVESERACRLFFFCCLTMAWICN